MRSMRNEEVWGHDTKGLYCLNLQYKFWFSWERQLSGIIPCLNNSDSSLLPRHISTFLLWPNSLQSFSCFHHISFSWFKIQQAMCHTGTPWPSLAHIGGRKDAQRLTGSQWSNPCQSVNSRGFQTSQDKLSLRQDTRQLITFGYSSFGMLVLCRNVMFMNRKTGKKMSTTTEALGPHAVVSGLILVFLEIDC